MLKNKIHLFGFDFDNLTYDQVIDHISQLLQKPSFNYIVTLNPEIVVAASQNSILLNYIQAASLIFADGIGLILANQLINRKPLHKITGADLTPRLFQLTGRSFYLIGAKPEILSKAIYNIKHQYPNINIIGFRNGYFSEDELPQIVDELNQLKPDIVLVALGSPKQDAFMYHLKQTLSHGIGLGIGGVFDVFSGAKPRAPIWVQKVCLEWVYRGIIEPKRILRWKFIPPFIALLFKKII